MQPEGVTDQPGRPALRIAVLLLGALALAIGLAARTGALAGPLALRFDAGCFAYVAERAGAGAHWLDFFDNKPPGIYALYRAAYWVGAAFLGPPLWPAAAAWTSALSDYVAILGALALGARFLGAAAGLAGAGALAVLYASARLSVWGQIENPVAALSVWSAFAYLSALRAGPGRAAGGWAFASGALLGLAMLCKQSAAVGLLAFALHLAALVLARRVPAGSALRWTGLAALGALAAGLPTIVELTAAGRWPDFLDKTLAFSVGAQRAFGMGAEEKLGAFAREARTWPLGAALAAAGALWAVRRPTAAGLLALAFALSTAAFFLYFGDFFDHYLAQLYPFAAILAGGFAGAASTRANRHFGAAAVLLLAGFVAHQTALLQANGYLLGPPAPGAFGYLSETVIGAEEQARVARAIESDLIPGEPFFSTDPAYPVLTGRDNTLPYHFTTPMVVAREGGDLRAYLPRLARSRVAVIDVRGERLLPPELYERLRAEWEKVPEGTNEFVTVWRRREP